jgi:hypothetical protein
MARTPWIPVVVGGVVGALLAATLFDTVLVILSSLVGAALLSEILEGRPAMRAVVFLLLVLVGIAVQTRRKRREA